MPDLETERLILKPTELEDAPFMLELLNSPKWLQYIGDRQVYSLAAAVAYIRQRILPQYARLGYGNYTVIRQADQVKVGACGLYDREGLAGIDIGFAFLPAYEGQGYAYEAAAKLKQMAFEEFNISEIKAITTRENVASQKLLEKLGLHFVAYTNVPGDPEELMLFRVVK